LDFTLLPCCCLSPIRWYVQLLADKVIIDLSENYPKQTFRNRFEIIGVNGRQVLTIPVHGQKGIKTPSADIRIVDGPWRKGYLHAIHSAYGRGAFFEYYIDDLTRIFYGKQEYLHQFNLEILDWTLEALKLNNGQLNMVVNHGSGRHFPFEKHGLGDNKDFRQHFEPSSRWTGLPSYPQVFSDRHGFQSNLSILDLLMNKGTGAVDYLLLIKNGDHSL
jgi:WbqC-like protein family